MNSKKKPMATSMSLPRLKTDCRVRCTDDEARGASSGLTELA